MNSNYPPLVEKVLSEKENTVLALMKNSGNESPIIPRLIVPSAGERGEKTKGGASLRRDSTGGERKR